MLSYRTVESRTLALLKKLSSKAFLSETRLVDGTALALFYGCNGEIEMTATLSRVKLHGSSVWNFIGAFFKRIFNGCLCYASMVPERIKIEATCRAIRFDLFADSEKNIYICKTRSKKRRYYGNNGNQIR